MAIISPYSVLDEKQVVAVVCNQWGDTGKGKFVDLFADWADYVARGTGGPNAGHTMVIDGTEHIFHQTPSSMLRDRKGKIDIMGSGMVLDLDGVIGELDLLEENNCPLDSLRISNRANLILPHHKMIDSGLSSMNKGNIGSTGKGVGPAYTDKTARFGITVGDLRDKETFFKKLKRTLDHHYYLEGLDISQIIEEQSEYFQRIKDFVCDTDVLLRKAVGKGKKVLGEGAQGLLLSIDYGTHPYVTSSDPSRIGLARGIGLLPEDIDLTLGIVKFPFMTRVGNGPFPTEYGGASSEEYCARDNGNANKRSTEERFLDNHGIEELMNIPADQVKGIGIRLAANEYGATTKRPRRTGRTDLVALKYAMGINGKDIILTKADCVSGMDPIELGVGYKKPLSNEIITEINHGSEITYGLKGVYEKFDGYGNLKGCNDYEELPENFTKIVDYLEKNTGARVRMISVGPEAGQTIVNK